MFYGRKDRYVVKHRPIYDVFQCSEIEAYPAETKRIKENLVEFQSRMIFVGKVLIKSTADALIGNALY
jgi:hypothetical protein